jgi:ATP-dependent helicase HepA
MIIIGSLVCSKDNGWGIGKIINLLDTQATVEYFCSVGERRKIILPLDSLSGLKLERQTRCYIYQENSET